MTLPAQTQSPNDGDHYKKNKSTTKAIKIQWLVMQKWKSSIQEVLIEYKNPPFIALSLSIGSSDLSCGSSKINLLTIDSSTNCSCEMVFISLEAWNIHKHIVKTLEWVNILASMQVIVSQKSFYHQLCSLLF